MTLSDRNRTRLYLLLISLLLIGGTVLASRHVALLGELEDQLVDLRIETLSPPSEQSKNIAVVTITDETLDTLPYRSPLDRGFLAKLVTVLDSAGARAIGLDILLDRPTESEKDQAFLRALTAAKVPVVAGWVSNRLLDNEQKRAFLTEFLSTGGARPGDVDMRRESDGLARRLYARPNHKETDAPLAFPFAIADALGAKFEADELDRVFRSNPVDSDEPFLKLPGHTVVSMPGPFLKPSIGGKIVLVGADRLDDRHPTPKGNLPGVVVHAHALSQILNGQELPRLTPPTLIGLVVLLALVAAVLVDLDQAVWIKLSLLGAGVAGLFLGGFWIYSQGGPLIPLAAPALGLVASYGVASAVTGRRERLQKQQIRTAFKQFLSPELVEELATDPAKLVLGGEIRTLTLMFSDIRGFTTLSEKLSPRDLTHFINSFLTPMSAIILNRRGTIDKYIGDAIMAFWNAPLDDADQIENACRTALEMRDALVEFNAQWRSEREAQGTEAEQVRVGIGLNTGECCVGNMGSDQRFAYSVLGDEVNLAARLEGQSKNYGVDIVVGENTAAQAPGFAFLELDLITVKGKTQPIHIHVLMGDEHISGDEKFQGLAACHTAMLKAYRGQDWDRAEAALADCRAKALDGLGHLYDLYESRIQHCRDNPPPPGWDGVYVATSK